VDYHDSLVIYNGKASKDCLAYVLCQGNIAPRFYLATISADKIKRDAGDITSSDGVQVQAIDGRPVGEFLSHQGLTVNADGAFEAVNSFPLIVDLNDGTAPMLRVMFSVTADGAAVCGGRMPAGSTLKVGFFDQDEIVRSASDTLHAAAVDFGAAHGLLAYSCVGRYINLCFDPLGEASTLADEAAAFDLPFMMAYCGGEHCPVPTAGSADAPTNRYHNCTMVICLI
jgi:hypothetical protein